MIASLLESVSLAEQVRTLLAEVQSLRSEVAELRSENAKLQQQVSDLRCEAGYWKSRHADAVRHNVKLQAELDQAKAEIRQLKAERFGKSFEKQASADRSNELADPKLHDASRKALVSLSEHWTGLTLFLDDARIPMDNNYGERLIRNPAVGRKNYYGSGSEWSGRLATMLFSIFATLILWKINPRTWLSWYFEACAANNGKVPIDVKSFLPWNLSDNRLKELRSPVLPATANTT